MTWEIGFVLLLLLTTFIAMVWEKWSVDVVALGAVGLLIAFKILTPNDAFEVFSNEAVITVACMFVLSAGLEFTGAIDAISDRLERFGFKSDVSLLLVTLPLVGTISAFVNNTPVVVVFMPVIISLAARNNIAPSRLLMPLSFAAIFGGTCTLIGTSTNILVSSAAVSQHQAPLGMFELTKLGVILGVVGLVYMLTLGRKLLPRRETLSSILQSTESRQYFTEAVVAARSPLVGRKIAETPLASMRNSRILDVTRAGEIITSPLNEIALTQGDRLRITSVLSGVMELKDQHGLQFQSDDNLGLETLGMQKARVMESVIGPNSELIGKTIRQVNFRQRFGILILAVHRQGKNLRENFEDVHLDFGDTILMEGTESAIEKLRADRNFLLLAAATTKPRRRRRRWLAMALVAAVVVCAVVKVLPISALALIAAVLMVMTGCVSVDDAYKSISWKVVMLIIGTLAMGLALERTNGASLIAHELIRGLGKLGPVAVVSAIFALTSLLTTFLSNNAVAVLLTPIVVNAANELGVDPRPFIVAVAFGASASFATPVGYQTNTLVYGAGGYRFSDFVRVGLPLNILFWLLATWLIPFFWPL
ncbi:SLC13 family permease [bacterium]|nr:SLC13 family permease [bacterium]